MPKDSLLALTLLLLIKVCSQASIQLTLNQSLTVRLNRTGNSYIIDIDEELKLDQ